MPTQGKKVSLEPTSGVIGVKRCRVLVDGKIALSASTEWWGKGTTTLNVASSQIGVRLDEHLSADRTYTWADKGGVSRVNCPSPDVPSRKTDGAMFVTIFITDEGRPNESAMKALITEFAETVGKSAECSAKTS